MKQLRFDINMAFDIAHDPGEYEPSRYVEDYLDDEGDEDLYQDLIECINKLDCKPKIISLLANGRIVSCVVEVEDDVEIDEDEIEENLKDLIDNNTSFRYIIYDTVYIDELDDYVDFGLNIKLDSETTLTVEIL